MVAVCCALIAAPKDVSVSTATKYPLEVHQMFRDRLERNKGPQVTGSWSAWSPWSTCSRTCGGGVTHQIRHCISRPVDTKSARKKRKRRQQNQCVGLYKRYHICNTQRCPAAIDFRAEQCAQYNNRPFKGKVYVWEPFMKASQECALNCRAAGMDFYATLNKTVIDGTSCDNPFTFLGKPAPKGTTGVCVDGQCKTVGLNGVIGSSTEEFTDSKKCCVDIRCKGYSGLFTMPQLSAGYSLVTVIPKGACRLSVQQLKHTRNFIALRHANGSYFLNGDWKYTPNGVITAVGTQFLYRRQDANKPETVNAIGVIEHPIEIMLLYQQMNPGIKYEYFLPEDSDIIAPAPPLLPKRIDTNSTYTPHIADPKYRESVNSVTHQRDEAKPNQHRRNRVKRKFGWKVAGLTACTRTCGGGTQSTIIICVRENTHVPVTERRCSNADKPQTQTLRCNTQACPARWGGIWGPCSTTCGPGLQKYELLCQQEQSPLQIYTVAESSCADPRPSPATRPCNVLDCDAENEVSSPVRKLLPLPTEDAIKRPAWDQRDFVLWDKGPWSACSATCGIGFRQRLVSCASGRCRPEQRPHHSERCDSGPCPNNAPASSREAQTASGSADSGLSSSGDDRTSAPSSWLHTEWSHCSVACGTGTQSRMVACLTPQCHHTSKPETERQCSSDKHCGEWFSGPWGSCPDSCSGSAKQKREVLCIMKIRGTSRIVSDVTCAEYQKPTTEQDCPARCPPRWFTGDWSACEGRCPDGEQTRDVRCLDHNGGPTNACSELRPEYRRSCYCDVAQNNRNQQQPQPPQSPPSSISRSDTPPPQHRDSHRPDAHHGHRDHTGRGADSHHHHGPRAESHHHYHANSHTNRHGDFDAKQQPLDQPADSRCSDKFSNCHLVVQARLCQYQYYESQCCISCRKAPPLDPTIK